MLPAGITSKAALLRELAKQLRFPDYFGANWDALWECIRDLSWLPSGPVILEHSDVPLVGDVENLKTYLSILNDTVQKKWLAPDQNVRDLIVSFPSESRERITWLLQAASSERKKK
jgi:hypothetical protein